jgi:hypothetical protein
VLVDQTMANPADPPGYLRPAGLRARLHVIPDSDPTHWIGRNPVPVPLVPCASPSPMAPSSARAYTHACPRAGIGDFRPGEDRVAPPPTELRHGSTPRTRTEHVPTPPDADPDAWVRRDALPAPKR